MVMLYNTVKGKATSVLLMPDCAFKNAGSQKGCDNCFSYGPNCFKEVIRIIFKFYPCWKKGVLNSRAKIPGVKT
jgi:hypothetical protein